MAEWTPAMVEDRLARRPTCSARCPSREAAGLLQRLARDRPQLRRQGRPGAEAHAHAGPPRTSAGRRRRCPGRAASIPLDGASSGCGRTASAWKTDLLGARHQPRHREPALALRDRGDRAGAQRAAVPSKLSMRVRGGAGAQPSVSRHDRRPRDSFRRDTEGDGSPFCGYPWRYTRERRARADRRRSRAWTTGAGFRGPAGVQAAKPLISGSFPGDIRMLAGLARHFASDRARFLGSHPESSVHPRRHETHVNSSI